MFWREGRNENSRLYEEEEKLKDADAKEEGKLEKGEAKNPGGAEEEGKLKEDNAKEKGNLERCEANDGGEFGASNTGHPLEELHFYQNKIKRRRLQRQRLT
jgi:hypothetical protein